MRFISNLLGAATVIASLGLTACSSINCPLDNIVVWTMTFYDSETEEAIKLPTYLSVDAEGAGNIYNKGNGINLMELPMSISAPTDTLYLRWQTEEDAPAVTDTLYVSHTNDPHFEAIDCPAAIFHTITDVHLKPHADADFPVSIDSVAILRHQVDYNDVENIRLYLRLNTDADAPLNLR